MADFYQTDDIDIKIPSTSSSTKRAIALERSAFENHSGADESFGLTGIALFGVIGYLPCRLAVGIIYA